MLQGLSTEFELEYPCHAPDQDRWFLLRVLPLRNATGAMIVHFNITERKRMEQSLQESREQVKLLLDSTGEAIYGLDKSGRCTFCNPAALRLLGYGDARELLGKPMHALTHHSYADGTPYPLAECRIHRTLTQGDYVHRDDEVLWRADHTCFPVEYWSHPIRKGDQMVGAVVTFIDISERRRIQQALQQERDRAQRYLDLVEVMLVSLDHNGAIQMINRKGCQVLGWREQELLGQDWFQTCLPEQTREAVREGFSRLIAGQLAALEYYENPVLTRDGQERLIAWHNVRLTAADGAVTGTLSSGEDITERLARPGRPERERGALSHDRRYGSRHDLDDRSPAAAHLPEQALVAIHRAQPVSGTGAGLDTERAPRRPRRLQEHLWRRLRTPPVLADRVPAATG